MGYDHPDDLLPRLTSVQWSEWRAFYALEPFGPRREDERAGVLASVVFNMNRGKDVKALEPGDFFGVLAPEPIPLKVKLRGVFGGLRRKG